MANWLTTEDERIVVGLLDFERSGIGFRHEDFAPMKYFGEDFRTAALAAYCEGSAQDPTSLLEETRVFDVLRELRGLGWALRNPQAGELQGRDREGCGGARELRLGKMPRASAPRCRIHWILSRLASMRRGVRASAQPKQIESVLGVARP